MTALAFAEVGAGLVLVGITLYDLFQSVVVPRPAVGKLRLSGPIVRLLWKAWRAVGLRDPEPASREAFLGSFAPVALICLLALWVASLILGYGLVLHGLRHELQPPPGDFGTAVYFSGVSLLTLGYGDIVPGSGPARVVALVEAANGFGIVALVVSLLFSLYGSFQRREVLVVILDAMAGAPPSAVQLLEKCREQEMRPYLISTFDDWRQWCAEVLESHLAYPILNYFRSSHDNESWLSSLGAVMDAATLVITTVEGVPRGPARLLNRVGNHLVEDLAQIMGFPLNHDVGIERFEFDQVRERLRDAGFTLAPADQAWEDFGRLRSSYAAPLNAMAVYWAIPPAPWVGDRSYMPHRERVAAS